MFLQDRIINSGRIYQHGKFELKDNTNGTFDNAESFYISGFSMADNPDEKITIFSASLSSAADIDIYLLNKSPSLDSFKIKQTAGTATCNIYYSSVLSTSTTDIADTPPLTAAGSLSATDTIITLNMDTPYMYIRCSGSQGDYVIESFPIVSPSIVEANKRTRDLALAFICKIAYED